MKPQEYISPYPPLEQIKENRYVQALFAYGIIPLTLLLEEYEQQENYDECKIIKRAIEFVNKYIEDEDKEDLPTRYSPEIEKIVKNNFNKYGFKGDIALSNTPYYIGEIKRMVNDTK